MSPRRDAEIAAAVPSSLMNSLPEELLVELGDIPDKISSGEILTGTVSRELGGLPVKPALSEVAVILWPREQDTEARNVEGISLIAFHNKKIQ